MRDVDGATTVYEHADGIPFPGCARRLHTDFVHLKLKERRKKWEKQSQFKKTTRENVKNVTPFVQITYCGLDMPFLSSCGPEAI